MTRWISLFVLSAVAVSLVAGCATFKGMGRDIQSAGEAIQDAAD